ncbi:MAG: hypothetical protein ACLQBQ_05325 [Smithella sp.]
MEVGRTTKDESRLRTAYETGIAYGDRFMKNYRTYL